MGWTWTGRLDAVSLDAWESLLARSRRPSPFLSPHFMIPWTRAFAEDCPKRIGIWERDGRTEGLIFLCRCTGGPGWELLGGEQVADALDAVVPAGSEAPFWGAFLESAGSLLADGPLAFANLVEDSPALALLPELCAARGLPFSLEEMDRSPYVSLPGTFEAYLAQLGRKDRHELRRKMRRSAEAVPDLTFRITGSREELARDFPSFVGLHRKSHPGKREFMDDRMAGFFRDIAEAFLAAGQLRLAFLASPRGNLASAFQVERDGALLLYNSGFDPSLRTAVPGIVLLARCIDDAIRRGLREYDFLRGRERYKYDLGGRDRIVYRAVIGVPSGR